MRTTLTYAGSFNSLNLQALKKWSVYSYLTSGTSSGQHLLALGAEETIQPESAHFQALEAALKKTPDWWFGTLSYDLKNEVEQLTSSNEDHIQWPDLHFFRPELVFTTVHDGIQVHFYEHAYSKDAVLEICQILFSGKAAERRKLGVNLKPKLSKSTYLENIQAVLQHIQRGDVYELNFCQEFYQANIDLDPAELFEALPEDNRAPFSALVNLPNHALICSSPERYLQKKAQTIISQPIKGTAPRGKTPEEDEHNANALTSSAKERSENVMIVDLVRNDLSRIATAGSVQVEELCGLYSFRTVHQLISTVSAQLSPAHTAVDCIQATFPMGSMTGAPKVRAMQLAEQYESTQRGIYSGAVGYFNPEGDFDFNVVIRSMAYNKDSHYLSVMAGGAITAASHPEKEYEECLLKIQHLLDLI